MKVLLKKILRALKIFVTKNVGYKILAVVFAIILWLVVVNIQNPESTKLITNIPVQVINESSILDGDHVYTIRSGDTATISIAGTRSVLSSLDADDFEAVADLSELSITNAAPVTVSLKSDMSRYENQINITQRTTSMIIDIESVVTRDFEVNINYKGDKPEDFAPDEIVISPETVSVNAPESKIDSVVSVGVNIKYSNIEDGKILDAKPHIYGPDGSVIKDEFITCSTETVNVGFKTYKTKNVDVRITPFGSPASGYEVKEVTYSPESIEIKADDTTLANISEIELPSRLLNVTDASNDITADIQLADYLPEGVQLTDETSHVLIRAVIASSSDSDNSNSTEETKSSTASGNSTEETTGSASSGNSTEETTGSASSSNSTEETTGSTASGNNTEETASSAG